MSENNVFYKHILKSTTLFGGVQAVTALISIIRSKIIALLLGPSGIGIAGLLNSAINLISGFTSMGLETSAVKFISQKKLEKSQYNVSKIIAVLKKILWLTGTAGALLMIVFSSFLSKITFANENYTIAFVWLSITLLLKQLSNGQIAILQGFQKLNFLAKANLWGSFTGLIISIPLYYYFRIDAIVPAIIISSITILFFSWFYARKIKIEQMKIPNEDVIREGKDMIRLGIMLSLSALMVTLVTYVLQVFISSYGIKEVGFYSAGITLLNSYVGLIFSSMSSDYFPRLSSVNTDNDKVRNVVSQQSFISILIITPIIIVFLGFSHYIIRILFSLEFISIVPMVSFGIVGMLFRSVSLSMGYILIAKGDSKIFIKYGLFFNSLYLFFNFLGYYFYGLTGIGIAFLVYYLFHYLILKKLTLKKYNFYFDKEFHITFVYCIFLCSLALIVSFSDKVFLRYGVIIIISIFSIFFSYKHIKRKLV